MLFISEAPARSVTPLDLRSASCAGSPGPKVCGCAADSPRMDKKTSIAMKPDVHEVYAAVIQTLSLMCRLRGIEGHELGDAQVEALLATAIEERLASEGHQRGTPDSDA